jgi:hypothetical protein
MDLQELGCCIGWIDLAGDRDLCREFVNAVMNFWVPVNVRNFLTRSEPFSLSRMTQLHGNYLQP